MKNIALEYMAIRKIEQLTFSALTKSTLTIYILFSKVYVPKLGQVRKNTIR